MKRWRVYYFRPHRKQEGWESRDQIILESESEPTSEQVTDATGDEVLRLDGTEQMPEVDNG